MTSSPCCNRCAMRSARLLSQGVLCPVQVMMFSATLHSEDVKSIAARICHQPILVDLKV